MTDKDRIIQDLVRRAKEEDWPDTLLYDEIWEAAWDAGVAFAAGLVDYDH